MRIRTAHVSLQFSDSNEQQVSDVTKIFGRAIERRCAWITGTESGPGAGKLAEHLVRIGKDSGYRLWVPSTTENGAKQFSDAWIAVRDDLIKGKMKRGYTHVIPGSGAIADEMNTDKKWAPKGLAKVSFDTTHEGLGRISVGAAHYLTGGREPGTDFWDWNRKLAHAIGDWAREAGQGEDLVFYGGDQNMADNMNKQPQGDTFFGEPFTSTWDELQKWENTGHGNIDVIASYNKDGRVTAMETNALNDREFHLNTDHFLVEATFKVEPLGS